jgi:hypothetical protein
MPVGTIGRLAGTGVAEEHEDMDEEHEDEDRVAVVANMMCGGWLVVARVADEK